MSQPINSAMRLIMIIWGVGFVVIGVVWLIPIVAWKVIGCILLIILGVAILFSGLIES